MLISRFWAARTRKAIGICELAKDYVSRDLISEILEDEERHQDQNTTELQPSVGTAARAWRLGCRCPSQMTSCARSRITAASP